MGNSVEYHLAKADYQCRRALSKLTREGSPHVVGVGHAIATLRMVRSALSEHQQTRQISDETPDTPPRYTRIVWTTGTPNREPVDRLEVSDDGAVWRVATDAEKRELGYLGKGGFQYA